jgi:xylitol oxidase
VPKDLHIGAPAGLNWAGNLAYSAARIEQPTSIDEIAHVARTAGRVKVLGSRHSFNDVADTDGVALSLETMPGELVIDADARIARVPAGWRYGRLARALDERGWALSALASLPHISLAGAVATGTHGSGDAVGSLATAVTGLELIDSAGALRRLGRGDTGFEGAVVSLGMLGVVVRIELDIVPAYEMTQTVYDAPRWDAVLADLDAVTAAGDSVSLFTSWRNPQTFDQAWVKTRGAAPLELAGARRASGPRHPIPGADPAPATAQGGESGRWFERLPHFRLEFTPSAGDELQSEYLVPRSRAREALERLRGLAGQIAPLAMITEVRTIAADTLWLSGAYGRDTVGIHFTWQPRETEVRALLPRIEAELLPLGARPHWGKLFTVDAEWMPRLYPRWDDFRALTRSLDPRGAFRNAYSERMGL